MAKQRLLVEANSIVSEKRSGIGHFTLELLKELDKPSYKHVEIIAYGCIGERKALKRHGFKRVKIRILPFPHKVLALFSRLPFAPSIGWFLGRGVYLFPNFRNLNVGSSKSLTFIHDVSFLIHPEFTQPDNLRYLMNNLNRWLRQTDKILTISEQSKREIMRELHVPAGDIEVVPLAVNPAVFYPRPKDEIASVCDRIGVAPHEYFLFVGNIEPRKNLEFLIQTYASNEKMKPYTLLLIGGDGWLNQGIIDAIELARQNGYSIVRNQSYVPDKDLPALMSGSIGLVMPSLHEGFGLPVVQALACGVPVAVSDIPVLRETAKKHGIYFDLHDSNALNAALTTLARDTKRESYVARTWSEVANEVVKYALLRERI